MMFDMSTIIAPLFTAVITGLATGISIYVGLSNKIVELQVELKNLSRRVDKHNNVIERTYNLERDLATCFNKYDALSNRIEIVEDYKIGGTR